MAMVSMGRVDLVPFHANFGWTGLPEKYLSVRQSERMIVAQEFTAGETVSKMLVREAEYRTASGSERDKGSTCAKCS